mgnify:CR=1 FL=1
MGAYIVDEKSSGQKSSGQLSVFFLIYNDWFELYLRFLYTIVLFALYQWFAVFTTYVLGIVKKFCP